jgi:predicted nicotinamide N-methyase
MDIPAVRKVDGVTLRALSIEVAAGIQVTIFDGSATDERPDRASHDAKVDPYASILWPSSLAAAMELPGLISPGHYVLDLGSGTGLATLTAARLGAYATAYDHDRFALRLIEEAAHLQGLEVETIHFDLHSPEPLPPADLMIVADLLYDYDLAHAVARRVIEQVRGGGVALIADPGRIASRDFLSFLEEHGIHGTYHPVEVSPPGAQDHPSYVGIHLFGE